MAPITQAIWKRTSKRAKDRPRLASGASRCTSESKASFPHVDTMATVPASTADAATPAVTDAEPGRPAATTTVRPSTAASIRSTDIAVRSRGARAAPISAPPPVQPSTMPRCHLGSVAQAEQRGGR